MDAIIEKVEKNISPIIENLGYEVVDIEYKKVLNEMNLTFYIYIKGGISLDDCEKVHNVINPIIDELNPTNDAPYVLNVSSPGLDRPFKKQRDFERNYGEEVEVKLFAPMQGKKVIEGILKEKKENVLSLTVKDKDVNIECNKISLVRPLVKFE